MGSGSGSDCRDATSSASGPSADVLAFYMSYDTRRKLLSITDVRNWNGALWT
jgi:hypothetical protein